MARTVSVDLKADVAGYVPAVDDAKVKTQGLKDQVDGLDEKLKKIPADSAKAAAAMRLMGGDADGLRNKLNDIGPGAVTSLDLIDQKIEETRANVRRFAQDFNQTGSVDSFNLWKSATKDLGDLERFKTKISSALKDIEPRAGSAGDSSGRSFTSRFAGVFAQGSAKMVEGLASLPWVGAIFKPIESAFQSMPPEAKIAIAGAIAAAIAGSGVLIGAALDAALLGGLGLGGIALGIAGQFNSPMVHSALAGLGQNLLAVLHSSTAAFVNPLTNAAGILNTAFAKIEPGLTSTFSKLSVAVDPLTQGLGKLIVNMMPGLNRALQAAVPILLVLGKQLPGLGSAISDMFDRLSKGGRGAGEALQFIITGLEAVIRWSGSFIGFLGEIFQGFVAFADDVSGVMAKMLGWIPGIGGYLKKSHQDLDNLRSGQDAAGLSSDNLKASMEGLTGAAGGEADRWADLSLRMQDATDHANALKTGMDNLFGSTMGVDQATLQYNIGVTNLKKSLDLAGHSLNEQTASGQKNVGAVLQQIQGIEQLRDANIANGMSMDQANGKYDAQLSSLEATLIKLGFNKDAVHALIDQYKKIPSKVSTTINVPGIDAANSKISSLSQKFNALNGKVVTTTVVTNTVTGETSKHTSSRGINRWGGIYEHAAEGVLNQAATFSTANPARYAFAEPATGGEAFVPRYGDYMRSTAILDQAAKWYGGRFVAAGSQTPSSVNVAPPNVNVQVFVGDEDITARTRVVVRQELAGVAGAVSGGVRV